MFLFTKLGLFPIWGASLSTIFSYSISIGLALFLLKKEFNFKYNDLFKSVLKIIITCLVMLIPLLLLNKVVDWQSYSIIKSFLIMILYALIGGIIFVIISYINNLLYEIFGKDVIDKFLIKLHLKKGE